jgi:hypothetical protein
MLHSFLNQYSDNPILQSTGIFLVPSTYYTRRCRFPMITFVRPSS